MIRYPVSFEDPEGKCVTAKYGLNDDVTLSVNNSQIVPEDGQWLLKYGTGRANQVNVCLSNKNIKFCYRYIINY